MPAKLTDHKISKIFSNHGLSFSGGVTKSQVGFSNDVYFVGDYVLKVGRSERNKQFLEKEVFFYDLFKKKLPVPQVVVSNFTGKVPYFIYEKILGENLYRHWHRYSDEQRRKVIQQLCQYLKIINLENPQLYVDKFGVSVDRNWQKYICDEIEKWKQIAIQQNLITHQVVNRINELMSVQKDVLIESKMALTYYDPHFDNLLVKNQKIVGLLDLERTDYFSIDYVLDLVKRMVDLPTKYVSKKSKSLIKAKDYAQLLRWYKEFYPQLFEFKSLEKRLNLYAIRYTLKILTMFPKSKQARAELMKVLE